MIEVNGKTFKSGNSVALRLPKELGIPEGVEVTLRKKGDTLEVTPKGKRRMTPRRTRCRAAQDRYSARTACRAT